MQGFGHQPDFLVIFAIIAILVGLLLPVLTCFKSGEWSVKTLMPSIIGFGLIAVLALIVTACSVVSERRKRRGQPRTP